MAVIELADLSVGAGGRRILEGVTLTLRQSTPTALVGPSGAGKTTLLRSLLGLVPAAGGVRLGGRDLRSMNPRERAEWVAWLPQQVAPHEALSTIDYLIGSRFARDESRVSSVRIIREALAACHVAHLADRSVTEISGGELQRVQLAGLLAQDARFFLLDEPANHLDPALQRDLYGLLADQIRHGRGIVAVTHEINLIAELETAIERPLQVVGLKDGEVAFIVASDAPDLDRLLSELYGLPHRAVTVSGRRYFLPGASPLSEPGKGGP